MSQPLLVALSMLASSLRRLAEELRGVRRTDDGIMSGINR